MAEVVGVSKDTVQRVWFARGLKPYRVETFKLLNECGVSLPVNKRGLRHLGSATKQTPEYLRSRALRSGAGAGGLDRRTMGAVGSASAARHDGGSPRRSGRNGSS